ncbi:hypothetical protein FRC14_004893 [Serendipita sp. 396]|nr:hypothetical protein FRC14_004893 [Serendipita sp. 396]KAG8802724.1 hypothetical protein FRC16_008843 [Serendipita sp. 398]
MVTPNKPTHKRPVSPKPWFLPPPPSQILVMFLVLFQVILASLIVRADIILRNYTVDDNDASMVYSGDYWEQHKSPLNFGGSHMLGEGGNVQVVFTFTGVSVYYLSSLWRYEVDSYVSLDGAPPFLVNLTASPEMMTPPWEDEKDEVTLWDVRWSATGLENSIHTVTITRGLSGYLVSDGFRFTVPVEDSSVVEVPSITSTTQHPTSTSEKIPLGNIQTSDSPILLGSNPSETTTPTSFPNPATSKSRSSDIAIATLASILGTLLIVGLILYVRRNRRRRNRERSIRSNHQIDPPTIPGPVHNNFTNGFTVPKVVIPPRQGWQETAAFTAMPTGASSSTNHSAMNYHNLQPNVFASQNTRSALNPRAPMTQVASQSITTLSALNPPQ